MLVGLHNQKLFSTGSMVLPEALEMPCHPEGFDNIVRMAMSGELAEPSKYKTNPILTKMQLVAFSSLY
ncbi:hypothetical protein ICC18_27005 [Paenibacillus sp. WST5]|uniref:Kanamycin nucleotidyltransferase C-terminal domain-containing protein n=1 Tax=Paenibacillus sedimenti TaxID=2770274 RepID=A0A926KT82_9BACL|nr:hypothetical protein [Paenibacillus sedimenti]